MAALRPGATLLDAYDWAKALLVRNGISSAHRDAAILLRSAANVSAAGLIGHGDRILSSNAHVTFEQFVNRRCNNEPVSRILGKRAFWDLELDISLDVLDPRADTETLIEAAVQHLKLRQTHSLQVLDLGTGSGAILCALASQFSNARCLGIEISQQACAIATINARQSGYGDRIQVQQADWQAIGQAGIRSAADGTVLGAFDLIVSNPPYIRSGDIHGLDAEVRLWDPLIALDGGEDGLTAYRQLAKIVPPLMAPDAWAILEIGAGQSVDVSSIMVDAGFTNIVHHRDLSGQIRALAMQR